MKNKPYTGTYDLEDEKKIGLLVVFIILFINALGQEELYFSTAFYSYNSDVKLNRWILSHRKGHSPMLRDLYLALIYFDDVAVLIVS